ncbi:MAG TPA: hypothetical protein VJN43_03840 [Bryobacteraceae bacterium]|nr:hypothetical protein [Bryobacteraceae bacterium]
MPWNLALLPLLAGFLFLRSCYYYKIRSQRFEGYRLLLESAGWAVVLAFLGRLVTFGGHLVIAGSVFEQRFTEFMPFPFGGTACVTLALGPLLAWLVNLNIDEVRAKDLAIDQAEDALLALFVDAVDDDSALLLTLDSRKIYVGFVTESPNLEKENRYLVMLPVISGYRNADDLTVTFTTDYISLWRGGNVPPESFLTVIPVSTIKTASAFDLAIYDQHFARRRLAPVGNR